MNNIKLRSGNKKILDSRSLFLFDNNNSLLIELSGEVAESSIKLKFIFKDGEKTYIRQDIEDDVLVITIINLKIDIGTKNAQHICTIVEGEKNYKIYFHFYCRRLHKDAPIKIDYTIFLEE